MILIAALLLQAAAPADFVQEEESEHLHFHYGWPAAAEAVPALRSELRARLAAAQARAAEMAAEGRNMATSESREMPPHAHEQDWRLAGSTPQLMSLSAGIATYTGGAHGNLAYEALLWDRLNDRPVDAAALLGTGLGPMTARYCAALDAQREEKRGEPVRRDPEDPHNACPPLGERVLAPADSDGNGRFDRLDVLIPPYAAGPYVEGDYVVEIPFDPGDLRSRPATGRRSRCPASDK